MARFIKGFTYAFNGIIKAIKEERNMRFHICFAIYVYVFSCFYSFTRTDYLIITLCVFGVLGAELINSAVERAVHIPDKEHYKSAGEAKDMAAGAVLAVSVGSAVCGVFLFWDIGVFINIFYFFADNILLLIAFLISLILSYLFIFRNEDVKSAGSKQ